MGMDLTKPQPVGDQGESEHDHLEGDHHGEDAQDVDGFGDPGLHPGNIPGAHGGADEDDQHRAHGDEHRPAHRIQKAVLVDGGGVVV